jgi:hypothetical protein
MSVLDSSYHNPEMGQKSSVVRIYMLYVCILTIYGTLLMVAFKYINEYAHEQMNV